LELRRHRGQEPDAGRTIGVAHPGIVAHPDMMTHDRRRV
jgi:hypothetical protein